MNDDALAKEVAYEFENKIVYNAVTGWMEYDGKVWARIDETDAFGACNESLSQTYNMRRDAYRELIDTTINPDTKEVLEKKVTRLVRLLQDSLRKAVFHQLKPLVKIRGDVWDKHPYLLNTPTGVVDLKRDQVVRHRPDYYFTQITNVGYYEDAWQFGINPEDKWHAARNDWEKAMEAIPVDSHGWIQTRIGQAASGERQPDGEIVLCRGSGYNGKTQFFLPVQKGLGPYFRVVPKELITGRLDAHPTERMALKGVRGAFLEELPEGRHLNVHAVKSFADTKEISGRYMGKDFVTFDATHSLFITSNYTPQVAESDTGTWRRLVMLTFPYHFTKPGEAARSTWDRPGDPNLKSRLENLPDRHEVVLSWIVQGARMYYKSEFRELPESVVRGTAAWREESDSILNYCNEYLEFGPGYMTTTTDLFDDFTSVLGRGAKAGWSSDTFTTRFQDHEKVTSYGVEKKQSRNKAGITRRPSRGWRDEPIDAISQARPWVWVGVRIKQPDRSGLPGLSDLSLLAGSLEE